MAWLRFSSVCPEVFLKSTLSLTGPFDPIRSGPDAGVKLDWETELAIVIICVNRAPRNEGKSTSDHDPDRK